jgi:hypothetical protein
VSSPTLSLLLLPMLPPPIIAAPLTAASHDAMQALGSGLIRLALSTGTG